MVLRFGATNADDVATLIAKKNYTKAIEVIKGQLKAGRPDARLRMQLGDVLILAGRERDASQVLLPLADEYANEGFAAKAVAVLKKIQKLDPGRRDIETRLAQLIQQKQNQAVVTLPLTSSHGMPEFGMEELGEIGLDALGGGSGISVPVEYTPAPLPASFFNPPVAVPTPAPPPPAPPPAAPPPAAPPPAPRPPAAPRPAPAPVRPAVVAPEPPPLDIVELEAPAPPPPPARPPRPPANLDLPDAPLPLDILDLSDVPPPPKPQAPRSTGLALPDLPASDVDAPLFDFGLAAKPAPKGGAAELLDQDLFTEDPDLFLLTEDEQSAAVAHVPAPEDKADAMSDGLFAQELLSLVEDAFQGLPTGSDGSLAPPSGDLGEASPGSQQIVISPLFKDFSVDEMVAVIQGLKLISFEQRQVILREGAPGDSMYMLTAGTAKAYVRDAQGKQKLVGELSEGAFFGEISILTGKPRTATVVAATRCEMLELDSSTLDGITRQHPHVRTVLEQFARERLAQRG
jgi:Cyclic nucleotide-binding domain